MLNEMNLHPTAIETLRPETHGGERRIDSFETQIQLDSSFEPAELGSVGSEMAYTDSYHRRVPAAPPKRMSAGTAYNWQGGATLSDTATGRPAPVMVASQRIAPQPPNMTVRVSAFGQVAKFSDLPIAA